MRHRFSSTAETSEISLKLDNYDDIFSDFDIRPYSGRALSVDFLDEIKRASQDKNENEVELILHMSEEKRSESHEATIKERLIAHFARHYKLLLKEKHRVLWLGGIMVALGILCMIIATLIVFEDPSQNLLLSFLVIFLEPAAWFLLWEGMDQIIFNSKDINPELEFYKKMASSNMHICFKTC